nr:hypothetical protein [Campylobacter sp. P0222]
MLWFDIVSLIASTSCLAICGVLKVESVSPPHIISPFKRFFKSVFFIGVAVIPMNSPLSFSITLKNLVILSLSINVLTNLYLLFSLVINNGFSKVGLIRFKYSNLLLASVLSAK